MCVLSKFPCHHFHIPFSTVTHLYTLWSMYRNKLEQIYNSFQSFKLLFEGDWRLGNCLQYLAPSNVRGRSTFDSISPTVILTFCFNYELWEMNNKVFIHGTHDIWVIHLFLRKETHTANLHIYIDWNKLM